MARTRGTGRAVEQSLPPSNTGSSGNPTVLRGSNSPAPAAADAPALPISRSGLRPAKSLGRIIVGQQTMKGNRVEKAAPKKKEPKLKPVKKECIICVTTRQVGNSAGRGFKAVEGACEHFQNTCNVCIGKMIKEKIVQRDLGEAILICAFPDCEHVLDYHTIMGLIFKGARENWDTALVNHHLRTSENYIACLNPACAQYFSIEDCQGKLPKSSKSSRGQKIACPHCEESMCMKCMRPWHASTSCSKFKIAEEKHSLQAITDMGAKPCPKCGVKIVKNGGCNHMKCGHCKQDFCFSCLVAYGPKMQHGDGCAETQRNIMQDPRNWLPDNVLPGDGWVDAMMAAAQGPPQPPFVPHQPDDGPIQVGAPQQPGHAAGIFGFLQQMMHIHARAFNNHLNGNANHGQNQP
ncbi:uncharacterized protein N0V89_003309 [Didymosphaeria variabile]|uniref:RBR-type E3 ubiquitin transferase n=1 Tax=Didymosphaeria variabile TaxID=1932322 RepID=A0A9W8XVV0_9PLEO|nr:uncharacterized protein N0V89_003309 [Didymosphaeria variabile]KAJ4358725.1 hypothetical protein N0V89_003309 [Didymosphaeria variabile]